MPKNSPNIPKILLSVSVIGMLILAIICAAASLLDHFKGAIFAKEHIYYTWWFFAIWLVLAFLLILTIYRFRLWRKPSLCLIHSSFLLILIGAGLSHFLGFSGTVHLIPTKIVTLARGEKTSLKFCKGKDCVKSDEVKSSLALNDASLTYVDYSKDGTYKLLASTDANDLPGIILSHNDQEASLRAGECMSLKNGACCLQTSDLFELSKASAFGYTQYFKVNSDNSVTTSGANLGCLVKFANAHTRWDYSLFGGKTHVLLLKLCDKSGCEDVKVALNEARDFKAYKILWEQDSFDLGFSVLLKRFIRQKYSGSDKDKDYISEILILDKDKKINATVSLNKPFDYGGVRFFAHEFSANSSTLLINYDPGKWPTYCGYFLLFLGCFMNLFSIPKRYGALLGILALCLAPNLKASELNEGLFFQELSSTLSKDYTEDLSSYAALAAKVCTRLNCADGQLKTIIKISSDVKYAGFSKLFKISPELAEYLGFKSRLLGLNELYEGSKYKLSKYLESISKSASLNNIQKQIINLDEAVNVVFLIMNEKLFNILVQPGINGLEFKGLNDDDLSPANIKLAKNYLLSLLIAQKTNDYTAALKALKDIKASVAAYKLKSPAALKTDAFLAVYQPFNKLCVVLAALSVLSLAAVYKSALARILRPLCALASLALLASIIARSFAASYIALNGTYESLLFIAFISSVCAIFCSGWANFSACLAAACFLLVAAISPAQISALVPVLNSPYLAYHVSLLSASYAFFAISAFLGAISAVKLSAHKNAGKLLIQADLCVHIGLLLLSSGTFLGAIWANETWGRYWAWDNKETWSLITILIYAALLHTRIKGLLRACLHLNAFASVAFTYFGVNFYLSGLHAYANANKPSMWYLLLAAAVLLGFNIFVCVKRRL